jgi:Mn-dependent DtxR family transcriptional regulator
VSKIILKMSYKNPNFKESNSRNVAHVNYISTRPGVDKSLSESDIEKELKKEQAENEKYANYINERPNSHGLFSEDGVADLDSVKEELSNTRSFVWRAIVSMKEEDAKELGFLKKENWQDLIRDQMPEMARSMNIKLDNLRWVAAVHMEKGHPHAHIMIWEKQPSLLKGKVAPDKFVEIKKGFTDKVYEAERFKLMQEKNGMRDLMRDVAKEEISELVREIKALDQMANVPGVPLRLYEDQEKMLMDQLKKISSMLPGKGRINYQFMPDEVKKEVMATVEYMLKQDAMSGLLEKNLKATKELTELYTGKEEQLNAAMNNSLEDIKKRVAQTVLKGASEIQKTNKLVLNQDLAYKAVDFIHTSYNPYDSKNEEMQMLKKVAGVLLKEEYPESEINRALNEWVKKYDLRLGEGEIQAVMSDIKLPKDDGSFILNSKKVDEYIAIGKSLEYSEQDLFNKIKDFIKQDIKSLENQLNHLVERGYIKYENGYYKTTTEGTQELLKIKQLNPTEKEILHKISFGPQKYNDLANDRKIVQGVMSKTINPMEIGKVDSSIYDKYFKENNSITLQDIENKVKEKYTEREHENNSDTINKEIENLKRRIEKLVINGYVALDKDKGLYSFTDKAIEDIQALDKGMSFTKHDANVTLGYIDQVGSVLNSEQLLEICKKEVVNKNLEEEFYKTEKLLEDPLINKKYFNFDKEGNITVTDQGKELSMEIKRLDKYLFKTGNTLNQEEIKKACTLEYGEAKGLYQYTKVMELIDKAKEQGYLQFDQVEGKYTIDESTQDISRFAYRIYQENNSINKEDIYSALEKHIPNKSAESYYKLVIKKLDFLKESGYLEGKDNEYSISEKGALKRAELLEPTREVLKNTLSYLEEIGLIQVTNEGYQVTNAYEQYFNQEKEKGIDLRSEIPKEISQLIDATKNRINLQDVEKYNTSVVNERYVKGIYNEIENNYHSIRNSAGVKSSVDTCIQGMSKILGVTGIDKERAKSMILEWNSRTYSNVQTETINETVDNVYKSIEEGRKWGNEIGISKKEWDDIFKTLDLKQDEIPKWIYGKDYSHSSILSNINNLWKSTCAVLERQRMQTEAQAEMMKKQQDKQAALNNKSARKEQARKQRSSGFYKDEEELER